MEKCDSSHENNVKVLDAADGQPVNSLKYGPQIGKILQLGGNERSRNSRDSSTSIKRDSFTSIKSHHGLNALKNLLTCSKTQFITLNFGSLNALLKFCAHHIWLHSNFTIVTLN